MSTSAPAPAPDYGDRPAPRKRVLWKWSLAFSAAAFLFLTWQCGSALLSGRSLSNAAVAHFHQQFNARQYEQIADQADERFAATTKRDELFAFLKAVDRKIGSAGEARLVNINVNVNTDGTFVTCVYNTDFARGKGVETFTWKKSPGAELKLYGYNIQSNDLVLR